MESKEDMSEKIFDMLTSNTEQAADSFSELFEFSSENDKEETVEEIIEMVDRDPTAVTSAFSVDNLISFPIFFWTLSFSTSRPDFDQSTRKQLDTPAEQI